MQTNDMKINILTMVLIIEWRKTGCESDQSGSRIVGGSKIFNIQETPFVVNIQVNDPSLKDQTFEGSYATGTIFSPLYVITACHCLAETDDDDKVVSMVGEYPLQYWRFVAGNTRLKQTDATAQFRTPASVRHHPKCQLAPYLMYDVGLAKMSEPFKINESVKPVRFLTLDTQKFEAEVNKIISFANTSSESAPICKVAGWGSTSRISILDQFGITTTSSVPPPNPDRATEGDGRDQLKSLGLYLLNEGQCFVKLIEAIKTGLGPLADMIDEATEQQYKQSLQSLICGLSKYGNESPCYGDSGAGLVCNGSYVGVTSWSVGCGAQAPEVFQTLPSVLDWIKKEVCFVGSCQEAINIHQSCGPQDPEFLEKCKRQADADTQSSGKIITTTSLAAVLLTTLIFAIK